MELSRDEQRRRDFADMISGWFWEFDEAGRYTVLSDRYYQITGDAPGSLIGKSIAASGFRIEDPAAKSAFEQAGREHLPFSELISMRTLSDGRRYWIRSSGIPVFDDDGAYRGQRGASTDVSALLEAEQKQRQSVTRLNDFAEASADFFWETNAELRYVYLSPVAEQSIGLDLDAFLGRTPREVIGDQFDLQDSLKFVDECMQARQPFRNVEFWRPHAPAGDKTWLRTSGTPYQDADGKFAGFRGSSTVITESRRAEDASRESERQFQLLASNIAGGLLYMDPDGRYRFVNKVYANWFGLEPEDFVGRTARDVLGGEVEDQVQEFFIAALDGKTVTYEATRETVGLGTRDVQVTNVPSFAVDGSVEGVFALVTDVTDLKVRERALEKSEQNLAAAQRVGQIGHWRVTPGIDQADWSVEMYRIWGLETTGSPASLDHVLQTIHPDDRQTVLDARETAAVENKPYGIDFRIVRPSGEIRHIRNEGRPEYDAEGRFESFFGVSQDITNQKLRETALAENLALLHTILDTVLANIVVRDNDDRITFLNRLASDYYEKPIKELLGKKPRTCLAAIFRQLSRISLRAVGHRENWCLNQTIPPPSFPTESCGCLEHPSPERMVKF